MWFKFPEGSDQINIEQQTFHVEAEDEEGKYFRAPDHFAPVILGLAGFSRVTKVLKGAPKDLPKSDPQSGRALDKMSTEYDALKQEHTRLLSEHVALIAERDGLKDDLADAEKEVEGLKKKIDELTVDEGKSTKSEKKGK